MESAIPAPLRNLRRDANSPCGFTHTLVERAEGAAMTLVTTHRKEAPFSLLLTRGHGEGVASRLVDTTLMMLEIWDLHHGSSVGIAKGFARIRSSSDRMPDTRRSSAASHTPYSCRIAMSEAKVVKGRV